MAVDIYTPNNKYTLDEELLEMANGGDDFLQKSTAHLQKQYGSDMQYV